MKSKFRGFYKESLNNSKLLRTATIVFDTNVLLDIYRYSKQTADQILDLMEKLESQLWMPYQVAYEYHKDRNSKVLGEHIRVYNHLTKTISDWETKFADDRQHPFLEDVDCTEIKKHLAAIKDILCKGKENCSDLIKTDEYKKRIADLFNGKLGEDYAAEMKEKHIKKAEERYKNQIPPGYKDLKKTDNTYGDYLIWQQMIDYAKGNECPVVFVSNDIKEDWIEEIAGIKLGPRPELIDEFYAETKQDFYCYSLKQFVEIMNIGGEMVNKEAQHEIEQYDGVPTVDDERLVGEIIPTSSPLEVYTGGTNLDIDNRSGI